MKKTTKHLFTAIFSLSILFVSCKKETSSTPTPSNLTTDETATLSFDSNYFGFSKFSLSGKTKAYAEINWSRLFINGVMEIDDNNKKLVELLVVTPAVGRFDVKDTANIQLSFIHFSDSAALEFMTNKKSTGWIEITSYANNRVKGKFNVQHVQSYTDTSVYKDFTNGEFNVPIVK